MIKMIKTVLSDKIGSNEFVNSRYFSWIMFTISLFIVVGILYLSSHYFHNRSQTKFDHYVDDDVYDLENRLHQYENTLSGVVGFLQASDDVTRTDWYHYISVINLHKKYPGIQGIGYSTLLPLIDTSIMVNQIKHDGYPSFELKPKGLQHYSTTILYLEPLDKRNSAAIGYDMFSEPIRREAMVRARDTGNTALSGKVTLIQEIDKDVQAGILMYLPYYSEEKTLNTIQQRRQSLLGYVFAPFRMDDLIKANFTHQEVMRLKIYDGEQKDLNHLLYQSPSTWTYQSGHYAHRTLQIGGRVWYIDYYSTSQFDERTKNQFPILFSIIGLILTFILMNIVLELLKGRSKLKKKTEALNTEKELAKNYLDIVDVMILVFDTKHTIQTINRRGCEILGYSTEEIIGKNFIELFIPKRIREELHGVANTLLNYNEHNYYENPILTKSGSERLIAWRNRLLRDNEGNVTGILSAGEDITDMRRTQEKLMESEAFYRTIFGSIDKAIIIVHDNLIVDCNDLALTLFNTTKENFVGQSIFDTAYEIECQDGSFEHHLTCAYNGEFVSVRCSLRLHTNPNHVKITDFSFSQFGSADENKVILMSRDITRKVEEEKMLTMHGRQAQMGEMISMIAHQWRQPLAIINAITTQIRFKAIMSGTEDDEFIDNLVKIEQQSSHLSQTISDYRDFFRPDKAKEHFRIVSLVNHALNLIDHTLKNHSIHIEKKDQFDPILYTYRNEVLQVLIALLKNALDAFIDNKVIDGAISINIYTENKKCVVSITDNAGGIQTEVLNKLFTPYFTTKNESFGTGLGLYMSRMIIEEHCDGIIEASSKNNTATFNIKLPYEEKNNDL